MAKAERLREVKFFSAKHATSLRPAFLSGVGHLSALPWSAV